MFFDEYMELRLVFLSIGIISLQSTSDSWTSCVSDCSKKVNNMPNQTGRGTWKVNWPHHRALEVFKDPLWQNNKPKKVSVKLSSPTTG